MNYELPGEFALRVIGDGMASRQLHDGDLALVKRAAFTKEMELADAVVIRRGDEFLLGIVVVEPSGEMMLCANDVVYFTNDDFVGPVVAVQHHFTDPQTGKQWCWAEVDGHDLTPVKTDY